ncbi:efflux transporter, RND family, MFP subunit [Paludibacter propionicigenes WB4]|uniref:Efflux transporter, RND family, MFP subunit n=1 Tax=Paludibacter propionicigenes (strain DSM 17365 / JCM 13257 / WB4) TaxID=694427 RepID=E4T062_PALPW|nr:efflux RND transporter periplasmic adaptor subunit [Paludibacter propionicigenes]ADQ78252.1 efflux transporter, RND family, MFP subunit [Paludibacter propionicigenes WB4]
MKKFLKIALLVILAITVLWTFWFLWKKSRPVVKKYEIVSVSIGNIDKKTVATGKVDPRNEILIKPQMSGIIAAVYKEAGDIVKAGDVIAKIKVIPDMVSLNSAESRVSRAQISYDQSKKNYDRDSKLFADKVISKEEFEKTQLQYNNDKEELKAAKDNLSLTRDGISTNSAAISNTLVRSTINGTILDVPIKVGNSVIQSNNFNDGTTIATVANMSDMLFVGKLDETEVGRIKVGMPMNITIGALQDQKLQAKLEYVSPKGKEESGAIMFEMKAAVKVPKDVFIRAGYSANAEIVFSKSDHVITIPESCIEFGGDTAFVYVLKTKEPQTFVKKQVKIGLSDGVKIEIKNGLTLKDKIRGAEVLEKKPEVAKKEKNNNSEE